MLLAGVAINAIAGAATQLLISVSDDNQLRSVTFWMMGLFCECRLVCRGDCQFGYHCRHLAFMATS